MQEEFLRKCFQDIKSNYSALLSTASSYMLRDTRNIQEEYEGSLESKKSFLAERKKRYKGILPVYEEDSIGLTEYFTNSIHEQAKKKQQVSKKEIDSILRSIFSFGFLVKEYGFNRSDLEELKLNQAFKETRALFFKNIDDSIASYLEALDSDIKPLNVNSLKPKSKKEHSRNNVLLLLFQPALLFMIGLSHSLWWGIGMSLLFSPIIIVAQVKHMRKGLYEDNKRYYEEFSARVASAESRFLSLQLAKNGYILTDEILFTQVLQNILLKLRLKSQEKGVDYKKILWRYLNILSSEFNAKDGKWDGRIKMNKSMIDQDLFLVSEIRRIHKEKKEKRERLTNKIKGFGKAIFS